jgi:hypothetical protein
MPPISPRAARSRLPFAALALSVFTPAAAAAPINLAPSGVATASSEGFGAVAADGNDGNRNGVYAAGSVFHTQDPDTAAFYQVDLGDSYYIDRVQIFPRTDFRQGSVENFRLVVLGDDGAGNPGPVVFDRNYVPTGAANFTFGTTDPGTAAAGGTRGRFVRLERLDGAPPFLTFAELEVVGQPAPLLNNVALGKPASASPPGFGATTAGGNDGNIGGDFYQGGFPVYHSAAQAAGLFFEVDLGEMVPLEYLELIDRGDGDTTTQFRVAVLDAERNEVYSTFLSSAGLLNYDHAIEIAGTTGRYVRVETVGNEFLAFSEIRAFSVVPEPGAGMMLVVGGGGMLVRRRRK